MVCCMSCTILACHISFCKSSVSTDARVLLQPEGPYQVTIVNRQYHMGRHMVNAAEVAQKLEAMPQIATAR